MLLVFHTLEHAETLFSLGEEELGVCLEEGGADISSVSPSYPGSFHVSQ